MPDFLFFFNTVLLDCIELDRLLPLEELWTESAADIVLDCSLLDAKLFFYYYSLFITFIDFEDCLVKDAMSCWRTSRISAR